MRRLRFLMLAMMIPLCFAAVDTAAQTVQGTKYSDLNGNGVRDAGEPGLPGWQIRAYHPASGQTMVANTNGTGGYVLNLPQTGTWIISEIQQAGWVQTEPVSVSYTETLIGGQIVSGRDFGNSAVCSNPANQLFGAGIQDNYAPPTEPAAPDADLTMFMNMTIPVPVNAQFDYMGATYAFGHTFNNIVQPNCYVAGATLRVHLRAFGPTSGNDVIGFVQGTGEVWSASIASLTGLPWNPPTTTVLVLDLANLPASAAGITNILAALQDGDLDIFVHDHTSIDFMQLDVEYCCDPGPEPALGTIQGVKYNDLNANGVHDAGEPGLANWQINARSSTTGQITSVTTDANGAFTFSNIAAGTWRLYETQQSGWVQTAPQGVFHDVTLSSAQTISNIDFGNVTACSDPATSSLTAGVDDNFAGGTEPSSPDAGLLTVMATIYDTSSTYMASGFDEPGNNKIFGHTFTGLVNDDCYVVGARLTIRLATNGGQSDNDRIGFAQGTHTIWGMKIGEMFNTTWTNTSGLITLDLANMPGTTNTVSNLLAALQDGDLDFFIQDDTKIDFATLEVDYCCFSASVGGAKYEDLNNNGVRDAGEPGLAGWTINAYNHTTGQTTTATTDASGNYSFPSLTNATWTIYEVQQNGWAQTAPSLVFHRVTFPGNPVLTGREFGNKTKCADPTVVTVTVGVNDNFSTANGPEYTSPSAEMQDYMYSIYSYDSTSLLDDTDFNRIIGHTFTGFLPDGCYITGGQLTIRVRNQDDQGNNDRLGIISDGVGIWGAALYTLLPGWGSTVMTGTIVLDLESLPGSVLTNVIAALQDGDFDFYIQDDTGIDYAELQVSYCCPGEEGNSLNGMKFHDLNGNGVKEPGEPGLADWEIFAYNPDTGELVAITTDGNGNYDFSGLDDGTWIVYEGQQTGWTQTYPQTVFHTVTISGGQTVEELDFGNVLNCDDPTTISVTAGDQDEFEFAEDMDASSPDPELQNFMNDIYPGGSTTSFFDYPDPDYIFGHTFTNLVPDGCYIVGARLTIAMQTLPGASDDDIIGFVQDGQEVWSMSISDLVGYPWVNSQTVITLDLANLPASAYGIENILAALQDGDLDVFIYDNTSIDYMTLEIDYCCPEGGEPGGDDPVEKYGMGDMQTTAPGAYPNPFSESTELRYELPEPSTVRISVYDVYGNPVQTFLMHHQQAGTHHVRWNGTDRTGARVANGVYVYQIEMPGRRISGQLMVQR